MHGQSCCAPNRLTFAPPPVAAPHPFARVSSGSTAGMRLIEGGVFRMGNERDYGFPADGEGPVHTVELTPFWIDECTVTNDQFAAFVDATGYQTEAERFGWSFVFQGHIPEKKLRKLQPPRVVGSEWWRRIDGASWRKPEGPGSNILKRGGHPVVQVSWNDACAYAAWAGKRLPTESEWEFAARGGLPHGNRFPWGDELEPGGKHRMNVWQGTFPSKNTEADGHYGPAPARSYAPNAYGLYCMTGNVWEWCLDWFSPHAYWQSPPADPTGPMTGEKRVMRGGSYLCHASDCDRYRVDSRYSNPPDTGTTNLGFRCVRDV